MESLESSEEEVLETEDIEWLGHPYATCPYCKYQQEVKFEYVDYVSECIMCNRDFLVPISEEI